MKKTLILKPVDNETIQPGLYLCQPRSSTATDSLWLVRVFIDQGYVCYHTPDDEKDSRLVDGAGHVFFELPKRLRKKWKVQQKKLKMWQWQPQWNKGAPSKPGKWLVRTKTGDEGVAIIYEDVRDEEDTDTKYLRFEMDGDSVRSMTPIVR